VKVKRAWKYLMSGDSAGRWTSFAMQSGTAPQSAFFQSVAGGNSHRPPHVTVDKMQHIQKSSRDVETDETLPE